MIRVYDGPATDGDPFAVSVPLQHLSQITVTCTGAPMELSIVEAGGRVLMDVQLDAVGAQMAQSFLGVPIAQGNYTIALTGGADLTVDVGTAR